MSLASLISMGCRPNPVPGMIVVVGTFFQVRESILKMVNTPTFIASPFSILTTFFHPALFCKKPCLVALVENGVGALMMIDVFLTLGFRSSILHKFLCFNPKVPCSLFVLIWVVTLLSSLLVLRFSFVTRGTHGQYFVPYFIIREAMRKVYSAMDCGRIFFELTIARISSARPHMYQSILLLLGVTTCFDPFLVFNFPEKEIVYT